MDTETSRPWTAFDNRCDACGSESFYHFERLVATQMPVSVAPVGTSPVEGEWEEIGTVEDTRVEESFCEWEEIGTVEDTRVEEFFFCGHHGNKHKATLTGLGYDHHDFTHLINPAPSVSANV